MSKFIPRPSGVNFPGRCAGLLRGGGARDQTAETTGRAAGTADLKPDVDALLMVAETGERANRQNENCPPLADKIDRERKPAVIAGCQKN
jgi:hypothetical protein